MSRYICLSPRSCCTTVRHALSFSQHHLRHASVSFTPGSQPIHADDGSAHISRSSFASSAPSTSQLCIKDHFMTGLESRYASRRNQIPIASAIANPLLPFPTPSWGKGGPAHRAAFPNQPSQSVRQPFRPSSGLLSANSGGGHEPSSGRMRLAPRRQLGERYIHHFTQGDLKQLLPDMMELGLRAGDHVTVAMSGGVDSSVTLRILSEMPLDLNVIYMRNWDPLLSENQDSGQEDSPRSTLSYSSNTASSSKPNLSPCSWEKEWRDVQAVAKHVGIPDNKVRLVDLSKQYWSKVFEPAVRVWEEGGTPNPDVACNREIKLGALLKYIPLNPRAFLATGHYARVKRVPHAIRLCRAKDMGKDQTYYLSSISEAQLKRMVLPLAEITKPWVRRLAEFYGLSTAEREESMGLCFVGERGNFGDFISQYASAPKMQGYLVDTEGHRLGEHKGLWHYTIGQGARLGGMVEPYFVARKGVGESGNDILVVPGAEHPMLMCTRIHTGTFNWIHGRVPKGIVPGGKKRAFVQLRHRMEPVTGVLSHDWDGKGLTMDFLEPIHGVAPGQVAAIWYQKWCLGSGVIQRTWTMDDVPIKSFREMKQENWDDSKGMGEGEEADGARERAFAAG